MRWLPIIAAAAALSLTSCSAGPERQPSIGEAFAGPATLNLRKDIDAKAAAVGTAHHGERLEIIAKHRRWYRVRTKKGVEGWADDRELLDTGQMKRLKDLSKETAGLPSQGAASTFGALNVHTEPNKLAPSFLQVKEGEKFDVIAHRVLARTALPKRELVPPKPKVKPEKKIKKSSVPPPPDPPAPALPIDWVALSKERSRAPEEEMPEAAKDDWTLIRTHDGQSGWVLTGRIYLAIPDEVAQYAEGHRITSYFSLGKTQDGDQKKDIWLWTTAVGLGEDHDFDGYRVFTWNVRRHRYETAFIQRREQGFFPVLAKKGDFSVCLEGDDGASRIRKQFTMLGNAVRLSGTKPCEKSFEEGDQTDTIGRQNIELHEGQAKVGIYENLKRRVKGLFVK